MISEVVNLSTGPVNIAPEVRKAFSLPPVSHRSAEFAALLEDTCGLLCRMHAVRHTFIMSGSGTLANEAMLYQIKLLDAKGLILSNGEFGSRLVTQAERLSLDFIKYQVAWGQAFDLQELGAIMKAENIHWILFCHCETSTGMVNDLDAISALCTGGNCFCFVDCISSVGNMKVDLSNISMATASSGKGLAAYPGLALVFSNLEPRSGANVPIYFDLAYYANKERIPFTISSNLVRALYVAALRKTDEKQLELISQYCTRYFSILNAYRVVPFSSSQSKVFTIIPPTEKLSAFVNELTARRILISHESGYLKSRYWCQLAVFGDYAEPSLDYAYTSLQESLQSVF